MDIICIIELEFVTFFYLSQTYNTMFIFTLFYLSISSILFFYMQDICDQGQLLRCENYILSYSLNSQGLKFILNLHDVNKPNKVIKTLEGHLPDLRSEQKLSEYFQNLEQLIEYSKISNNIKVSTENESTCIKIISKINTKKTKELELAQISLIQIKRTVKDQLNALIQRCNQQQILNGAQIKSAILHLAQFLYQSNNKPHQNQNYNDNQNAGVQDKVKQILLNNQLKFNQIQKEIQKYMNQFKDQMKFCTIQSRLENIQQQLQKNKIVKQNIRQLTNQFNIIENIDQINSKLKSLQQRIKNNGKIQVKSMNQVNGNITIKQSIKLIGCANWIDPQCYHYNRLSIGIDNITAEQSAHIFGRIKLTQSQPSFTVTINRMKNYISVGIVDTKYKKQNSLKSVTNRISYCSDGDFYNGKQWKNKQGSCFTEREKIIVSVNFKDGVIQWRVGTNIRFTIQLQILKDQSIGWVPYLYLCQQYDNVSINL